MASFEIFSAAAALRARSETAGTTSPRLKAGRSPPQCSRAPLDALLCRNAPKSIFTGNIPSLSAQNSPRTASQRVIFNPPRAKVVIFACAQPRPLTLSRWSAIFAHAPRSTGGLWHPSTLPFSNIQPPARCARTGLGKAARLVTRRTILPSEPSNDVCLQTKTKTPMVLRARRCGDREADRVDTGVRDDDTG